MSGLQSKRLMKIKVKEGTYFFKWEVFRRDTNNWDQHTLTCKDIPRPELLQRLRALAYHVAAICEFNMQRYEIEKIIISGISLSYGDDGNRYLVITAQRHLEYSKAPLIINTPARPEQSEGVAVSEEFCWSAALMEDIDALEKEAWEYIDGNRAQQKLDFDGEDKSEKPGGDKSDTSDSAGNCADIFHAQKLNMEAADGYDKMRAV